MYVCVCVYVCMCVCVCMCVYVCIHDYTSMYVEHVELYSIIFIHIAPCIISICHITSIFPNMDPEQLSWNTLQCTVAGRLYGNTYVTYTHKMSHLQSWLQHFWPGHFATFYLSFWLTGPFPVGFHLVRMSSWKASNIQQQTSKQFVKHK